MCFEKMMKKLDVTDIGLIKLSVFAFALWLVSFSQSFAAWVQSVHPIWFLAIFVAAAVRPFYRAYIQK
ncbi:MAG: hypothetical protein KAI53_05340 [Candidatus Aenigmarchaeota archaeon]|nr:hypothetical protein [Candidatus Aenigmarchaeota archaeon]